MTFKFVFLLSGLILFACKLSEQSTNDIFSPPENPSVVKAFKTTYKITLDGSLDEEAWA